MKTDALARLPFLQGLPPRTAAAIARVLRPVTLKAGATLFQVGDPGDACYLIEGGSLSVTTEQGGSVLATLGPGSFVGELALILGEPRTATVTATTRSTLLELARRDLDALMEDHPSLASAVTRELGRRIVHANQRISGDLGARRTVVWPAARVSAVALAMEPWRRRVGVGALGNASIGATPPGSTRVRGPSFGSDSRRLQAVLLGAPDVPSPRAIAAVADAEHVLAFGDPPAWLADAAPSRRMVRVAGDDVGLRRAARWASGRSIGLALSSGGSKTVAHIGVLRVLRESGLEFDAVVGTSGGALAAWGLAFGLEESVMLGCVSDIAKATRWNRLDFNLPPRSALFKGRRLRALFHSWGDGRDVKDALVPLYLVAADVATGAEVVLDSGPVADAMRASMSVPGAFDPWRVEDKLLIDGAVVNPLPVDVLRGAGVGIVVASNVAGQSTEVTIGPRLPGLMHIIGRMLNTLEREVIRGQLPRADLIIRPSVSASGTFDFSNVDGVVEAGVAAAQERIADIAALVAAADAQSLDGRTEPK